MKLYYESFVSNILYDDLGDWQIPNISSFSNDIKSLFPYQVEALKNVIKLLYYYYNNSCDKKELYNGCIELGMNENEFNVKEYNRNKRNGLFDILKKHYSVENNNGGNFIPGYERFNRASFWMATASGKTIVIIKLIEIIDYLQSINKIPKNDIMVLFPDAGIEKQFKNEVKKYNYFKQKQIKINSLKDYDDVKAYPTLLEEINIFSYRSDLLSEEEKDKKININAYDNNGKWFVFMDEAHKGDKSGESKRQNYITQWTRNGFLFNFSATFTDALDYATTIYNYNLERFINDGYGKNIYVSDSYFTFNRKNEFNDNDKQKQVLKSLITFTLIKKQKVEGYYHNPLMVTLVDTVHEDDSDLYMFFKEIEKVAIGDINTDLFDTAKNELAEELIAGKRYSIGSDKFKKSYFELINDITLEDILENVFNSSNYGKIEIKTGEANKEIAMQLETANTPFMLIKIGDTNKFKREKLGDNYQIGKSYATSKFFDSLNSKNSKINILLGSRAFYEGWDSNRPNVLNFINIGSSDAKKFVLQSIGRGVRIQPVQSDITYRKRARDNDSYKNELFETLFVYATNKSAVSAILTTLDEQKITNEVIIDIVKENHKKFDLLLPVYGVNNTNITKTKFLISEKSLERVKELFDSYPQELFMFLYNQSSSDYDTISKVLKDKDRFKFDDNYDYKNAKDALNKLICQLKEKEHIISSIKTLDDEICHYKYIKAEMDDESLNEFEQFVNNFISSSNSNISLDDIKKQYENNEISLDDYTDMVMKFNTQKNNNKAVYNSEIILLNIMEHLYSPIVLTISDQIKYLKHVINVESERKFVENLNNFIQSDNYDKKLNWSFSKVDQTTDAIFIWYFNPKTNRYDKFYPDFIFWLKHDNNYDIYFIDPKGLQNVDYQFKIQGYCDMFEDNNDSKEFKYVTEKEQYDVKFHLLLVGDTTVVPEAYKKYCIDQNDFTWLK